MKRLRVPSHQELVRPYFKTKLYKQRIETGIRRLKVISQIIQLREELGLTQAALAEKIGVTQPYIARIENDEGSNLGLETLLKIVDALNGEIQICIRKKAA